MNYLSPEQVLFLHARLIEETGGGHGLRDLALLESAGSRPQATFGGQDLYPDLFAMAAALMESLIRNHPFSECHSRTHQPQRFTLHLCPAHFGDIMRNRR
jgi:death-on-curing protein